MIPKSFFETASQDAQECSDFAKKCSTFTLDDMIKIKSLKSQEAILRNQIVLAEELNKISEMIETHNKGFQESM
jgi:hypothetical protein